MRNLCIPLTLTLGLSACADDLGGEEPDAGGSDDLGHVTRTDNGDGTATTIVDATSQEAWIYLDLDTGEEKTPMNPATSNGWDLAFQRFQIKVNGGVSGGGDVAVAVVPGGDFDAMTTAPDGPYGADAEDGDDEDADPDLFFDSGDGLWYDYDPATHVLTPRDNLYVVRTVEGEYVKIRILDYYDDAGTAGYLAFRSGTVAPR